MNKIYKQDKSSTQILCTALIPKMGYPFQILKNEEVNITYLLGNIQG